MKKSYIMAILAVSVIYGFTSCDSYLDRNPLDSPSTGNFYTTQDEIEMGCNACYNYLAYRITKMSGMPSEWHEEEEMSDGLASRYSGNIYIPFKQGTMEANVGPSSDLWKEFYRGVFRTNALLYSMGRAKENSSPEVYDHIEGQTRAIRAWCYWKLISHFGDVPFYTHQLGVEEALAMTKTPYREILNWIYAELDAAADKMPASWPDEADKGRITKGTAYGMKARIALYYHDFDIAREAAKKCMDLGVYKLFHDYNQLFDYAGEYCDEIVMDTQFMENQRQTNIPYFYGGRNHGGQAQAYPTEMQVASYECTDGLPIDESPLYDPNNPFANRDPRLEASILLPRVWDGTEEGIKTYGTVVNNIEFMSSKEKLYAADGITMLDESLYNKEEKIYDGNHQLTGSANQEVTNDYASYTGYVLRKMVSEDDIKNKRQQKCYKNIILMRYAEILLIYAEASVELNKIDQSVLDAINMVRARAYGNTDQSGATNINADNYPKITTMDQAELRKVIRRERKVELFAEGIRHYDLNRWGLLIKCCSNQKIYGRPYNFSRLDKDDIPVIDDDCLVTIPYGEDMYGINGEARKMMYRETYATLPEHFTLFPLPESEMNQLKELIQNEGYKVTSGE